MVNHDQLDHWNTQERVGSLCEYVDNHIDLQGLSVLDIGCELGHFSKHAISRNASSVTGIEKQGRFLQNCKTSVPKMSIIHDDFNTCTFPKVDVIFCFGVLYHTESRIHLLDKCRNHAKNMIFMEALLSRDEKDDHEIVRRPWGEINFTSNVEGYKQLCQLAKLKVLDVKLPGWKNPRNRIIMCLEPVREDGFF